MVKFLEALAVGAALAAVVLSSDAVAQTGPNTWLVYAESNNTGVIAAIFIDADQIQGDPVRQARSEIYLATDNTDLDLSQVSLLAEFDCASSRYRNLTMTIVERDGRRSVEQSNMDWTPVPPGSRVDRAQSFVCATPQARSSNSEWSLLSGTTPAEVAQNLFRRENVSAK